MEYGFFIFIFFACFWFNVCLQLRKFQLREMKIEIYIYIFLINMKIEIYISIQIQGPLFFYKSLRQLL